MSEIDSETLAMLKRLRRDVANDILRIIRKHIVEMDLISHVPREASLLESWEVKDEDEDTVVESLVEWAFNVEFGRLAGSPVPREPIVQWLIYKLKMREVETRRIAHAVALTIEREGLPARRFLRASLVEFTGE